MIDLRSDTITQPTEKMRQAMAVAVVGDDVYGDDPTVNELEKMAAEIVGKESALFVPTGTMGNQLAIMAHTSRGDDVLCGRNSHIYVHEVGAHAVLSGVTLNPIVSSDDIIYPHLITEAIRETDIHTPPSTLLCVENALSNGGVVPQDIMEESCKLARESGLKIHMDGARILNAAVALKKFATELVAPVDSVMFCLSKGLCAPVGSILAGEETFITRARKSRKLLGGGMRQAGILAAAGIIALNEMISRLEEDHNNARRLEELLNEIPHVTVYRQPHGINMVFFSLDVQDSAIQSLPAKLLAEGIKINGISAGKFRLVTNNSVSANDIDVVVDALRKTLR